MHVFIARSDNAKWYGAFGAKPAHPVRFVRKRKREEEKEKEIMREKGREKKKRDEIMVRKNNERKNKRERFSKRKVKNGTYKHHRNHFTTFR